MVTGNKTKILVVEDAIVIAEGYQTLLESSGYDVILCYTGVAVQSLIDEGETFDLAIMDIMLPSEDFDRYSLAECQDTGFRLIRQMIERQVCQRFYVISVRPDCESKLEKICDKRGLYIYEDKLDHEPSMFIKNVGDMLAQAVPDRRWGTTLLPELRDHVDFIDTCANRIRSLSREDKQQLMSSMKTVRMILSRSEIPDFATFLRMILAILQEKIEANTEGALKGETKTTIAVIQEWLKKYG